jgi:hypothetical protein
MSQKLVISSEMDRNDDWVSQLLDRFNKIRLGYRTGFVPTQIRETFKKVALSSITKAKMDSLSEDNKEWVIENIIKREFDKFEHLDFEMSKYTYSYLLKLFPEYNELSLRLAKATENEDILFYWLALKELSNKICPYRIWAKIRTGVGAWKWKLKDKTYLNLKDSQYFQSLQLFGSFDGYKLCEGISAVRCYIVYKKSVIKELIMLVQSDSHYHKGETIDNYYYLLQTAKEHGVNEFICDNHSSLRSLFDMGDLAGVFSPNKVQWRRKEAHHRIHRKNLGFDKKIEMKLSKALDNMRDHIKSGYMEVYVNDSGYINKAIINKNGNINLELME